jgi:hypothetical protein
MKQENERNEQEQIISPADWNNDKEEIRSEMERMNHKGKQHRFIIENAKEITKMYLEKRHKTKTAEHFGIAINSVDRALHATGNADLCSKWFVTTQTIKKPRYPFLYPEEHWNKLPKKQMISKKTPTFEEFFEFLFETMNKAKRTTELEKENKELIESLENQNNIIQQLRADNINISQLRMKWEMLAKELKHEMHFLDPRKIIKYPGKGTESREQNQLER